MNFTFGDFCSGIGGFRIALEKIGATCIYSCEIDRECVATYNTNFNDDIEPNDLLKIDSRDLPDFDILCAGFPCQPFSIAGKRKGGNDERAAILPKILEITDNKRPKVVFLENVPHFLRLNHGAEFKKAQIELERQGYIVFHQILDSAYFNVPQSRPRLFIVAFQKQLGVFDFSFPKGTKHSTPFRSFIHKGDFSIPITKKWGEYIDFYSGKKMVDELSFIPPKTRTRLERTDKEIDLHDCIYQIRSSGIRAISLDRPFPTLAVSISGGGAMIPVYSGERRHLNLVEMRRLMGFPDNFKFPVSRTASIKQLANSVCPPVIEAIAKGIIESIEGVSVSTGQLCLQM